MKKKKSKSKVEVVVTGDFGLKEIERWKAELSNALAAGSDFELKLSGIESVDTFGVQLVVAAVRSAAAAGRKLTLSEAPESFERACAALGIDPQLCFNDYRILS